MKKKMSGQITIETSIVLPIVMMIVASLVYISFYVHDVITIKSFVYSLGIQSIEEDLNEFEKHIEAKVQNAPTFVLTTNVSCEEKSTCFMINVKADSKNQIKWLKNIMGNNRNIQSIKIEKKMPKEIMYGYRAVCDELEERRSE